MQLLITGKRYLGRYEVDTSVTGMPLKRETCLLLTILWYPSVNALIQDEFINTGAQLSSVGSCKVRYPKEHKPREPSQEK